MRTRGGVSLAQKNRVQRWVTGETEGASGFADVANKLYRFENEWRVGGQAVNKMSSYSRETVGWLVGWLVGGGLMTRN